MIAVSSLLVRLLLGLAIDDFACSEALGVVVARANSVVEVMGVVLIIVGREASTTMLGGKVGVGWPLLRLYGISGRPVGFEEDMTGPGTYLKLNF